jgi:hypothetical protein
VNVGGLGAFAGGLSAGYLAGEDSNRRNRMVGIQEAEEKRKQTEFEGEQASLKDLGGRLDKLGFSGLAAALRGQPAPPRSGEAADPTAEAAPTTSPGLTAPPPAMPKVSKPTPAVTRPYRATSPVQGVSYDPNQPY